MHPTTQKLTTTAITVVCPTWVRVEHLMEASYFILAHPWARFQRTDSQTTTYGIRTHSTQSSVSGLAASIAPPSAGASSVGAGVTSPESCGSSAPQSTMTTSSLGLSAVVGTASISFTTSIPDLTFPNTTCLSSRWGVSRHVMKIWPYFCWFVIFIYVFAYRSAREGRRGGNVSERARIKNGKMHRPMKKKTKQKQHVAVRLQRAL